MTLSARSLGRALGRSYPARWWAQQSLRARLTLLQANEAAQVQIEDVAAFNGALVQALRGGDRRAETTNLVAVDDQLRATTDDGPRPEDAATHTHPHRRTHRPHPTRTPTQPSHHRQQPTTVLTC